jgi:hypothetical protein
MYRLRSLRVLAGWALVATLVAGAGTQHNHSLFSELLDSSAAESGSERFLTTHQDNPSSPLHWDRVLRVEGDGCVACHAQRSTNATPSAEPGRILEVQQEVVLPAFRAPDSCVRLPDSCRAPPPLL